MWAQILKLHIKQTVLVFTWKCLPSCGEWWCIIQMGKRLVLSSQWSLTLYLYAKEVTELMRVHLWTARILCLDIKRCVDASHLFIWGWKQIQFTECVFQNSKTVDRVQKVFDTCFRISVLIPLPLFYSPVLLLFWTNFLNYVHQQGGLFTIFYFHYYAFFWLNMFYAFFSIEYVLSFGL